MEAEAPTSADGEGHTALPVVDEFIPEPVLIPFPPPPTRRQQSPASGFLAWHILTAPPTNPIVRLSAGTRHNLAVSRGGNAYSWGSGNQ